VRRSAGRHPGGTGAFVIAVRERPAIVTVATASLRDLAHVRPRHMAALATVPQDPSGGERNMLTSLAATRRRPHMAN